MNVTDRVYSTLRRRLATGFYEPGSQLKEEMVAQEFGVSRTPVRAAFTRLIAETLLTPAAKRGAIVTQWRREDIDEIFAMRMMLEGHGAELCARNATPEQRALLFACCDKMELAYANKAKGWLDVLNVENRVIHETLYDGSGSGYLRLSGRHLLDVPIMMGGFYIYTEADILESFRHHRELARAIEAGNGEWARAVIVCHLSAAKERFVRLDREKAQGA